MTKGFTVVVEQETNGSWSAWVAEVPGVYAAADTAAVAKRAIRSALQAHLAALEARGGRLTLRKLEVMALRYTARKRLQYANLAGALLGRRTSPAKADAARLNGRKGGRPRVARA